MTTMIEMLNEIVSPTLEHEARIARIADNMFKERRQIVVNLDDYLYDIKIRRENMFTKQGISLAVFDKEREMLGLWEDCLEDLKKREALVKEEKEIE